jgi:ATP diphosphatase
MTPSKDISRLLDIMAALRDPQTGCAWDVEQTFQSIMPYTIEETYEVADAINRNDMADLCDELGDLLLQVVFHARMAEEAGHFSFGDVVHAVTTKMIRRHPHVFGDETARGPNLAKGAWERIKAEEKAEKRRRRIEAGLKPEPAAGLLSAVPGTLPAFTEATKLQAAAARVGFDWPGPLDVLDKLDEESRELRAELAAGSKDAIRDEFGDLAFVMVNLARHAEVDPETALKQANSKFRRRFNGIEAVLAAEGRTPADAPLDELEALWRDEKRKEKGA